MPFFGLVWTTSWVSCFLAASQGLFKVPDYIITALPAKVFSVVNSPIELPHPPFLSTPLPLGSRFSSATLTPLPTLDWQLGIGESYRRTLPVTAVIPPGLSPDGGEPSFCPSATSSQPTVAPSSPSSSHLISSPQRSNVSLGQQLLQVMQSLLPWRHRGNAPEREFTESVTVVSTHTQPQDRDTKISTKGTSNRRFWQYSQQMLNRSTGTRSNGPKDEAFQVKVKGRKIAQFPTQQAAEQMAQSLKLLFCQSSDSEQQPLPIQARLWEGIPVIKLGDRLLFKLDDTLVQDLKTNRELLAIEWANNLRLALGQQPLKLEEAQKAMHNLVETSSTLEGLASWYGPYFHGRLTATGETYDQQELTAAHPTLPFDTYLKVRNLENGRSVIVRINDRGPYVSGRSLDLSLQAARSIHSEKAGIVPFEAVIMKPASSKTFNRHN